MCFICLHRFWYWFAVEIIIYLIYAMLDLFYLFDIVSLMEISCNCLKDILSLLLAGSCAGFYRAHDQTPYYVEGFTVRVEIWTEEYLREYVIYLDSSITTNRSSLWWSVSDCGLPLQIILILHSLNTDGF